MQLISTSKIYEDRLWNSENLNKVNYDALNVVWKPADTRPSGRHSWLQIFSTHFPSGIGYLLSLKTILIPRKTQKTNNAQSQQKTLEQGVNYFQS